MYILNPIFCYNSLDILPYVIDYYQKENIEMYILDNYSTDKTWEFLQKNKIPSKKIDTNETFNIQLLLKYRVNVIKDLKPDWVIRVGIDCFITTFKPLRKIIEEADSEGYNSISMPFIRLWNTGEKLTDQDPRKVFFNYSIVSKSFICAYKFANFKKYDGDKTRLKNKNVKKLVISCILDYGNTRGKEKREEEYKRRQLAWDQGLPKKYGVHYIEASKKGWVWDIKKLNDIRKSKYWDSICERFNYLEE